MKKYIILLLVLCCVCACDGRNAKQDEASNISVEIQEESSYISEEVQADNEQSENPVDTEVSELENEIETIDVDGMEIAYFSLVSKPKVPELVEWYKSEYGEEIPISLVELHSPFDLKTRAENGNFPDIVLLDKNSMDLLVSPYDWIKAGYLENLSDYMFADANFNEEDYLQGSIKAGKVDGEQYLLPLAVRSSYWLVQESVKHETVLDEIDSTSSTETILNCIIEDYQDHEKEDYFTEIRQFYTMSGDYVLLLYDLLEQTGALHINWDERSVVVNEELFAVVVDYMKLQVEASQRNSESGGTLASDYEVLFDLCTVISSNANPTYTLHYLNTLSSTLREEELELLPLPLQGEEREYAAGISMLGMVGKDSKYKEEAWQVLKAMMDVPADAWMEIYGGDFLKETPVALQTNYDLIAMFSQEQTADIMANEQSYAGISLSAKQCEMLKEMIDNTTRGYIFDYNVYSEFGSDSYALLSEEAYNTNELCSIIVNEIEDYIQE